ncbi:MAG: hypothetical protein AAFY11_06105 [Cyanobacteria bacterium J06641_5]
MAGFVANCHPAIARAKVPFRFCLYRSLRLYGKVVPNATVPD